VVNSPGIFDPRFSWHGSSEAGNASNVNRQGLTPSSNLPSTARVALTSQPEEKRHVLHVLYAPAIHRGGNIQLLGGKGVEVIEDLPQLHDVEVTLQLPVTSARLVPQGGDVTLEKSGDRVTLRVPAFSCHQMIEIEC
jgi:hypothetical protein